VDPRCGRLWNATGPKAAHGLHPHGPLGEGRRPRPHVRGAAVAPALNTKTRLGAAGPKQTVGVCPIPGHAYDASVGRDLLSSLGVDTLQIPLVMDRVVDCCQATP